MGGASCRINMKVVNGHTHTHNTTSVLCPLSLLLFGHLENLVGQRVLLVAKGKAIDTQGGLQARVNL